MDQDKLNLIDETYEQFSRDISNLHDFWNTIKRNTEQTLEELQIKKRRAEEINANPKIDEILKKANGKTYSNHFFNNPYTGDNTLLGHSEIDISKKIELCFILKNKQYQWVLTEAYELFEDYIESLYACAGYIENDFWPASDYGSVSISDIVKKDLTWFKGNAEKKDVKKILSRLRLEVKNLAHIEIENALKKNYHFNITMIEHLRHVIVHKGGYFGDTSIFIDNVLSKAGINGKQKENAKEIINMFIGKIHSKDSVVLLEKPSKLLPDFMKAHFSNIRYLLNVITEYSFILKEELKKHLSNK